MEENKKEKSKKLKLNKKNKRMLILVAILIVIIIILLLLKSCTKQNDTEVIDNKPLDIDETAGEYVEPEKEVDHSKNIVLPGWGSFTIPKDTTDIDKGIDMYNPDSNFWYKCPKCGTQLDNNYKCLNEKCNNQCSKAEAIEDCYYMTFKLVLADTNETLYESKLVEPGKHLQHITINRPLPEGEYNAYVFIQPYKSDRATACNNGKVNIKLNVK